MDIPPDELTSLFRVPDGRVIGIEISVDLGGKPVGLDELLGCLVRLRQARAHVAAVGEFGRWIEDPGALSGRARHSAEELARALDDPDPVDRSRALDQFAHDLGLFLPFTSEHRLGARFEFVGGYRENPTGLRFIARGTAYALVLLVTVLGTVQVQKEYGAEACRAQSGEITRRQLALLEAAARRQGRWTPEMVESHKVIVRAS
ncbi:hypothetical protein [Methylobacterium durans]|uniref:Uncharacterized protein n=1 Tax=Methylobacterium durans TaxID=2202825 RepID=A0A2U8W8U9_9HYPH|nr:hypothetical protein [Methylobacterium durans]AWN42537.1 hypothetical protein DK389_21065 [Methylobacterium durans]